jgi:hypothetical protein
LLGAVAVSCIGLVLAPGCEQGGADGRLAVSGTVTFEGAPLDQGSIEFTSTGEGPAVFTGAMIENGKYSVPAGQGLPPGTYLVKISSAAEDPSAPAPEMPGMPEEGAEGAQERIPAEYNTESTQEVTVTADGENKFDFNIQ